MQRLPIAIQAARAGGSELLRHQARQLKIAQKSGASDVVTSADLASEVAILAVLKREAPGDVVVSEESDDETRRRLADPAFTGWVIDPLDGTNSFRDRMNYSGVSVGYIRAGQPVCGAILDPFRDELLAAEHGRGAELNGQPVRVAQTRGFDKATRVCISNSYSDGATRANLERQLRLPVVPWTLSLGSAVLIMREVAVGRADLYHHNGLKPWDNAAGFLIVAEAGGKICGLAGEPVNWTTAQVVMGNPVLVDEFLRLTGV